MGKTKKHQQLILLDPGKAALLAGLSKATGIPKQALLREAVDDLLHKHRALVGASETTAPTNLVQLKPRGEREADRFFDDLARSAGLESFEQMRKQVEIYRGTKRAAKKAKPRRKN
jgi:hypothetical protein